MTRTTTHETATGVQDIADALRSRLHRYIEAAYHLRDSSVVDERRMLLNEPGAIAQEAFLETTPSYELGRAYAQLGLPNPIGSTLEELAAWEPGIGIFARPYRHQAEALQAFFNDRRDLIVSTGTGSGKTETFLLPILGSLLEEAAHRRESFNLPGFRALLLYPMNALVSDQIARLRRLFGDERLSSLFRSRYRRHPRFGMYTSRTPYPGQRDPDKDRRNLDPLLRYYLDLEEAAQRDGPGSQSAQLVGELRSRGRWPAKDLAAFFGKPGSQREKRLLTQPGDRELLTRHEMQQHCPDILVTNYSMLEYMLMRPIERSIFAQTRDWLAADPTNNLILVVDEAHLYRGTAGAEVAYLIRRLQARLEIPRERLRCILTSASLGPDETVETDALSFAEALTGSLQPSGRSFQLIRGYREPRPPARQGTPAEAQALAAFDQAAFVGRVDALAAAAAAVRALSVTLNWPTMPDEAATHDEVLRRYLYERLDGFGPLEWLIAQSTGNATSLSTLAQKLFPEAPFTEARRALETLLTLGTYAHNGQRPRLQTRVHMLFRGLPSLWACVNPHCHARLSGAREDALLGRLYTAPRTHCTCGARVYELLAHRDCGSVFLRAFGAGDQADFYWHEMSSKLDTPTLQETWLIVERPHRDQERKGAVEPIWMDCMTGRVATMPPLDRSGYRQLWRVTANAAQSADDDEDDQATEHTTGFKTCPVCLRKKAEKKILDLATRGERPFANIVHEQFRNQPHSRPVSAQLPNGGRKVLIFADGRQKAARLARDLPREVELDTFRQALVLALHKLEQLNKPTAIDNSLYIAFVAVCHEHRLHFFDKEFDSQARLLKDIHEFEEQYDADLAFALDEWPSVIDEPPMRYRQLLFDMVCNPFYGAYALAVMVTMPITSTLRRMRRDLAVFPEIVREQIETITTFWIQEMLRKGAFDKSLPEHVRQRVSAYAKAPTHGKAFKDLEAVLTAGAGLNKDQLKHLRTLLYNEFTAQDERGLTYLKPQTLALKPAFDATWQHCDACSNLQHTPLLGRCAVCGAQELVAAPPDALTITARYDYYRQPLRDAVHGTRPAHLTAEEHTAQLSQRDAGAVYATTEEFELRFQDIALGTDRPPVDVLSCTTTMEVGIDIGSLVAIGMRNVPPQRENYQQRAGRAGRRGSAVSTVVTYADSGPHDHFYFAHPEHMIAGPPRRPLLSIDRRTLAQRHINASLLQTFFHSRLDRLSDAEQVALSRERVSLFTALGSFSDFFRGEGSLTMAAFKQWLDTQVFTSGGSVAHTIAAWLPEDIAPGDVAAKVSLVVEAAQRLVAALDAIEADPPERRQTGADGNPREPDLLDVLFDAGLLPSYAFPTDLASFYVFGRDGDKVVIKERPQQSKLQALSEYAPGRLLVVNKETYRVGGIYVPHQGYDAPVRKLFAQPLPTYVYCPECTYLRLEPLRGHEQCPICRTTLQAVEMLDPPGFAPEKGIPVGDRDREQEMSYAIGAQLPLPVAPDALEWHPGPGAELQYAYAENQRFVAVNRGPDEEGFVVCEACGAAWPAKNAPKDKPHDRPYLTPSGFGRSLCRGTLHAQPISLGTTFRSDLLLIRSRLQAPLGGLPGDPWLQDALRTTAEALALAASRVLDVDPAELSAGFRLLPCDGRTNAGFDFYLYDTASGGAGYAAEAGAELQTILQATLELLEDCPGQCERSCTRCLRHYGNRFWHRALDRHLAAQLLRHILYGEAPEVPAITAQRRQLAALRRFLELEGWDIAPEAEDVPLAARWHGRHVTVGVYPALLDPGSSEFRHPLRSGALLLRDYVLARDLPAAYAAVRKAAGH